MSKKKSNEKQTLKKKMENTEKDGKNLRHGEVNLRTSEKITNPLRELVSLQFERSLTCRGCKIPVITEILDEKEKTLSYFVYQFLDQSLVTMKDAVVVMAAEDTDGSFFCSSDSATCSSP